jgi:hypothetical protein
MPNTRAGGELCVDISWRAEYLNMRDGYGVFWPDLAIFD